MKKYVSGLMVLALVLSLGSIGSAAVKKVAAKKVTKPAATAPAPTAPALMPTPVQIATPPAAPSIGKSPWSAEGGFAGGGLSIGAVYTKLINDKLTYRGQLAYSIGSGYGVVIADLARVTYDLGGMSVGGGLTYAMYSQLVQLPGVGTLTSQNLVGVELLGTKSLSDKMIAIVGYNTALGIRASVNYSF